jgi:hypothetical protein
LFRLLSHLLIFFLLSPYLVAQTPSKLRVYAKPDSAIIKSGELYFEYGKFKELDTGTYIIKAWAPTRQLVSRTVELKANQYKTIPLKLPYTPAYKKYLRKNRSYKIKKMLFRYSFIAGYLLLASNSYAIMQHNQDDADHFFEEAEKYKTEYEQSFWEYDLQFNRSRFEQNKLNYDEALAEVNSQRKILIAGAAATAVLTYVGWKISNKLKKPVYEKETPLLSDMQLVPAWTPQFTGLTLLTKLR